MSDPIFLFVDFDTDVTRVYPDENGDGIAVAREFKTKREAEAYAEKEVARLKKLGHEADWGANY